MAGVEKARERAWRREVREVAGTEGGPLLATVSIFCFRLIVMEVMDVRKRSWGSDLNRSSSCYTEISRTGSSLMSWEDVPRRWESSRRTRLAELTTSW